MSNVVRFSVAGVPAPQGSKTPFGSEANPRTRPWRAAVSAEAAAAMGERELFVGPVRVGASFRFTRPKSHFRTGKNAHLLRDDAPRFQTTHPDLDKLQRAVGDSLTGVVIRDDKQIAQWAVVKLYADRAGVDITVIPLSREERNVQASLVRVPQVEGSPTG